jgi:hypothetical protein
MRSLPATSRSADFDFQQLRREGDIAIFVKQKPPFKFKRYEVVIIQKRDAYTWPNGQTTLAHEAMPSSRDWGKYPWTYRTLEDCESRFKSLVKTQFAYRLGTQLALGTVFMHQNRERDIERRDAHFFSN